MGSKEPSNLCDGTHINHPEDGRLASRPACVVVKDETGQGQALYQWGLLCMLRYVDFIHKE